MAHAAKPGQRWAGSGTARSATTNAARLAGQADSALHARTARVRRIVAVGDSFTFGVGVNYGERFTEGLRIDAEPGRCSTRPNGSVPPTRSCASWKRRRSALPRTSSRRCLFLGDDLDDLVRAVGLGGRALFELRGRTSCCADRAARGDVRVRNIRVPGREQFFRSWALVSWR